MKSVTTRDLQKKVKECVDLSQSEKVVVTRHGKPAAVLVGVEGKDWQDLVFESLPAFWQLIEKQRTQPTLSRKQLKARLSK